MLGQLLSSESSTATGCQCRASFDGQTLSVDASDCSENGRLSANPDCLATVIEALGGEHVESVVTTSDGIERAYLDADAALLVAAGRFAARIAPIDERLAERTKREPRAAAREATGRSGPVADLAAETGLAVATEGAAEEFEPYAGPTISDSRLTTCPPDDAVLRGCHTVSTGATVRRYDTPDGTLDQYHIRPPEYEFDQQATGALEAAADRLVAVARGDEQTPEAAVDAVLADTSLTVPVATALRKHTQGLGVLEDIFADRRVTDVFATAPVETTPLRVRVGDETLRTNVRLTERGARALASTFRRTSGRAFSQASPTVDATAHAGDRQIRVAGVTEPISDGLAFAFRAHDGEPFRLSDLVENGTLSPDVAGLLSVAVERGCACLVAGPRGAGKTTTLGALLWALPESVRTVVIEDTPELPVTALQADGRDVQALRTEPGDGPSVDSTTALRSALRLGDGALVVGEVRGEEASTLYEAMRVGSGDRAVLGTIHGTGGDSVRERLVSDLGVPERAFSATDLVVTLAPPTADGGRGITAIEEVIDHGDTVGFESLFERDGSTAMATGRIGRGTSQLLAEMAGPSESYADVQAQIQQRTATFQPDHQKP
jgi:type IV secretory pathway ATPase VirB11/archaellum biosynthesis ATPase